MRWSRSTWDAEGWREDAACRCADTTAFFPVGASGPAALELVARAKEVCASCPVVQECLIFAVTTNQEFGVWGGLDEDERRDLRRQWRRAASRTRADQDRSPVRELRS